LRGHFGPVISVAFSQDGEWIISGSLDKTVHVWNMAKGGAGVVFKGHSDVILSVAFSLDSSHIVSASSREQIIWDVQTQRRTMLSEDDLDNLDLGKNNCRLPLMHLLDDGWVVGLDNQQIFWIPADNCGPWTSYGMHMVLGGR
jgi:WD40 repeat protein